MMCEYSIDEYFKGPNRHFIGHGNGPSECLHIKIWRKPEISLDDPPRSLYWG